MLRSGRQPDILHCHDWSTAEVAKSYWNEYQQYGLWKPNVVRSPSMASTSPFPVPCFWLNTVPSQCAVLLR
jgi:hypothetical protein